MMTIMMVFFFEMMTLSRLFLVAKVLMSDAATQTPSQVIYITPLHTSHLTPHTSHVTPHTSHLTPHTSHLTPHISINRATFKRSSLFELIRHFTAQT